MLMRLVRLPMLQNQSLAAVKSIQTLPSVRSQMVAMWMQRQKLKVEVLKAMAGGVVATSGGSGAAVNTKVTLGVFDNSSVRAKAKAGDGAEAYAGGVISASKDK